LSFLPRPIPCLPRAALSAAVLLVIGTGCYHPAIITPESMPAGDFALGVGISGITPSHVGDPKDWLDTRGWIQSRVGLGLGFDAGLCLTLPAGPYVDVKWNFLRFSELFVTADLGASLYGYKLDSELWDHYYGHYPMVLGFHPTLLLGRRDLFGGARLTMARHHLLYSDTTVWQPSVMFGGSVGDRVRFLPGIEVSVPPGELGVTVQVGVEFHTRTRAQDEFDDFEE